MSWTRRILRRAGGLALFITSSMFIVGTSCRNDAVLLPPLDSFLTPTILDVLFFPGITAN